MTLQSKDNVILITGSRKGIGRDLCLHYLESGWNVVGCSRGESSITHDRYMHFSLDVSDEPAVRRMFSDVRSKFGGLRVLINNAGIASMNHALLTPMDTVRRIFETNTIGTFLFCREAAKLMKGVGHARIVNFTTVAAPLKLPGEAVYAASKAAVISLTEILAFELAALGITVNAIGPTPIKTDLVKGVPEAALDKLVKRQAIQRFGTTADVINVVDFFVQKESDFITGQTLFLGGV